MTPYVTPPPKIRVHQSIFPDECLSMTQGKMKLEMGAGLRVCRAQKCLPAPLHWL